MTASALTRPGERDRLSVKVREIDWTLVILLSVVAGTGVAMLYSIAGGHWQPWAADQLIRYTVVLVMALVLALVHPKWWFRAAYPMYAVLLLMVMAVDFTPLGYVAGGARNWLNLGFIRIQPAEFMKLGLVLALARWYHNQTAQEARFSWKLIVPAAMIGVPFLLVAKQPDLGSAMIIGLTGAAVMFVAGLSWKIIATGGVIAAVGTPLFVLFGMHDYQRNRVLTFLDPTKDPSGTGYNIIQSKIALGSGGFLGRGYGLGSQSQLEFLPERETDFIFSTVAEEFGFVGSFSLLLCYVGIILIGLRIASLSHSHFGRIAASGMVAFFALFVLINGAMVMGLAPVVGVPMPLLSYGGSSMMTIMFGFGLVLSTRVHRYSELPKGHGLF
ncbi:MAG: rod shape-determining protein RodA [Alphaproteobacteria bacterium]|nr:rod shape-determining protein RodA [Alphaproteobacteria bacterium]MBU1527491.1 rod shape-determining protein RodA [Alphaproteobacteria bacterium]MBU2117845.1 rod shape-determining protein RodA [Alphaproteobacteria bacterium]MBU2352639.1 rod shape-determining protein RodA [Alphaproteobacteria bacterium]MBU2383014.1 rod shape-determining protein RodA [Alphaproteobacteria bacterium]